MVFYMLLYCKCYGMVCGTVYDLVCYGILNGTVWYIVLCGKCYGMVYGTVYDLVYVTVL